jgi:hypothetical protein
MRARAIAVAAATVASLLLAGCGGIPTSGSVGAGQLIDEEEAPTIGYLPSGPQDGATPAEILNGFITAATSPQENFAIAREFLTGPLEDEWEPNAITQVRSGLGSVRQDTEQALSYSFSTSAYVDSTGRYFEDDPATQTLNFTFAQEADGEWRISAAPDGIVLSRDGFETIFEKHPLYYFDSSYRYLVPDVRWFPKTALLSTRVVTALLAGQADWLQQGVTNTEFPIGTTLSSRVSISEGVATVDLSEDALAASAQQRERMVQQLKNTIGNIATVELTVNGVSIDVPDPSTSPATINPQVESQLLVLKDGGFGFLSASGGITPLPSQSSRIVELGAQDVTLSRDGSVAAVLAPTGVHLAYADGSEPRLADPRPGLVAPSADSLGFVWSAPASSVHAFKAFASDGTGYDIDSLRLPGGRLVSFAVSRDGARMLTLVSTDLGYRLAVSGILRRDGIPYALGDALELPMRGTGTPLDAAWIDDSSVATLVAESGGTSSEVTTYELGGPSTETGRVEAGTRITGGNGGVDGLRVLTLGGEVFRPRGNGWANTGTLVSFIATQQ